MLTPSGGRSAGNNPVLFEHLKALDYSGNLESILARIEPDTLAGLMKEIDSVPDMLLYFALRLRSASEGRPREEKPLTSLDEIPRIKLLTARAIRVVVMEDMRRRGRIEVLKMPLTIEDEVTPFELRLTKLGRERKAELEAKERAESANGAEGVNTLKS